MNSVWPSSEGTVDSFWQYEWHKHGTCMTTLEPECYDSATPYQGLVDYFTTAVEMHKQYPIYKALSRHGIVPGYSYPTAAVILSIQRELHALPILHCDDNGTLVETWLYFHVKGPIRHSQFYPMLPDNVGTCKETVYYPIKYQ
ncbi:ribonuclease T2 family protein [Spinellus fusiger]|nr:ribonuclease T2 family protein [Spinellus fusiger]